MSNKTEATFHGEPSFDRTLPWLTTRQLLKELAERLTPNPPAKDHVIQMLVGLSPHELDSRRLVQ